MLEVGKTYRVEAEDCCLQAHFTAKLLSMEGEGEWGTEWTFDNGVTLECSERQLGAEEVK